MPDVVGCTCKLSTLEEEVKDWEFKVRLRYKENFRLSRTM